MTHLFSRRTLKRSSKSAILSCSADVETAGFFGSSSHLARALAAHSKKKMVCNKQQKVDFISNKRTAWEDEKLTNESTTSMHVLIIFKLKDMTPSLYSKIEETSMTQGNFTYLSFHNKLKKKKKPACW